MAVRRAIWHHPSPGQWGPGACVLRACVAWCAERQPHLRVDTHADNAPMLHLLPALGFVRCGIIHVADGTPRIAFERLPQVGG